MFIWFFSCFILTRFRKFLNYSIQFLHLILWITHFALKVFMHIWILAMNHFSINRPFHELLCSRRNPYCPLQRCKNIQTITRKSVNFMKLCLLYNFKHTYIKHLRFLWIVLYKNSIWGWEYGLRRLCPLTIPQLN